MLAATPISMYWMVALLERAEHGRLLLVNTTVLIDGGDCAGDARSTWQDF